MIFSQKVHQLLFTAKFMLQCCNNKGVKGPDPIHPSGLPDTILEISNSFTSPYLLGSEGGDG